MALIKKYQVEIVNIINKVNDVFTIELKPINRKFKYSPGHFFHLALDEYDPSSGWPESRCFSIQSSPAEKNLRFTYAVKGKYTKRMATELAIGKQLTIQLPFGELFLQEHKKENTVFISGGTGITPFLSLFTDDSFSEYKTPFLYAGYRNRDLNFYSSELTIAKNINPSFLYKEIYQDTDGFIDIKKIAEQHQNASFFVSGPPEMIKSFKTQLIISGIKESDVLTDDWE